MTRSGFNPSVPPNATGCSECLSAEGWWLHLRRCAQCGHVGCCDSSPAQHASRHARASGHPVAQSFEPGEDCSFYFFTYLFLLLPSLPPPIPPPLSHPTPLPPFRLPSSFPAPLHLASLSLFVLVFPLLVS